MNWSEFLHHWFIDFGWFGFHPFTAITLMIPFFFVLWRTRKLGPWAPIYATASVTLSIHVYESLHAATHLAISGYTGRTIIINVAIAMGVFLFIYITGRTEGVINSWGPVAMSPFLMLSFFMLGASGFFDDYPYSIEWGWEMISTKIMAALFGCSLFLGEVKDVST